jgi:hypothetical protein
MNRHSTGVFRFFCFGAALILTWAAPVFLGAQGIPELPLAQALKLGERMYREGVTPSGEPLQAFVSGDVPAPGTTFSCVSCHLRGGLGSNEGGIKTPPANGATLFQLRYWTHPSLTLPERTALGLSNIARRPAYTEDSLATVIRTGIDPTGRGLLDIMPRYALSDRDMAFLTLYLKHLSTELSPGATDTELRFATVITEEVSPADREAMLVPLDYFIEHFISVPELGNRPRTTPSTPYVALGQRRLSLARWVLRGAPRTWARQLEAYQKKEPVFALLGGITYGSWKPIHDFCEAQQLPCLFPITDLPVVSDSAWYTLYLSKGYYQEGQATARYLARQLEPAADGDVLQLVRDTPEGQALAQGFLETWAELGRKPVRTVGLRKNASLTSVALQKASQGRRPAALLLWTGPEALPVLAQSPWPGSPQFLSARYLGQELWNLPAEARGSTYLAFPYRDPQQEHAHNLNASSWLRGLKDTRNDARIYSRCFSLVQVLGRALKEMDRNLYRDTFLDVIGMMEDMVPPDYERLSFGPGQRYASKGCYIVQLSPETPARILKKSGWVSY